MSYYYTALFNNYSLFLGIHFTLYLVYSFILLFFLLHINFHTLHFSPCFVDIVEGELIYVFKNFGKHTHTPTTR